MKQFIKFAALAALMLSTMVACKSKNNPETENENVLKGPFVNVGEVVNGKLTIENSFFQSGEALSVVVAFESNGKVFYNGGESKILTVSEAVEKEISGLVSSTGKSYEGKRYEFTVTINPPIDDEVAEFTLEFAVEYENTIDYDVKLTIVRNGIESGAPKGALKGKFSISQGMQVYFAKGNLEYDSLQHQFSFAEVQYKSVAGVYGYDRYASEFQMRNGDFDVQEGHKWAIKNAEPSNESSSNYWFIPSAEEWEYLVFKRPNAEELRAYYNVSEELNPGGNYGLILLPDNYIELDNEKGWDTPFGNTILATTTEELDVLSSRGAIILPPSGWLNPKEIYPGQSDDYYLGKPMVGAYWSSSVANEEGGKISCMALLLSDGYMTMGEPNLVKVHQDYVNQVAIRMAFRKFPM